MLTCPLATFSGATNVHARPKYDHTCLGPALPPNLFTPLPPSSPLLLRRDHSVTLSHAYTYQISGTAEGDSAVLDPRGELSAALPSKHRKRNRTTVLFPLASGKELTMYTYQKVATRILLVMAVCSLVVMLGPSGVWAQTHTYSGQATVVRATVLGVTTVLSDTGPLPSS